MTARQDEMLFENAIMSVTAPSMEPIAAQARRVRAEGNAGMLCRPQRRITAVGCLVLAAQFLAPSPQPRGVIHPSWYDLPIDDPMHLTGRMQGFVVRAPRR